MSAVHNAPATGHGLDVELLSASELCRRVRVMEGRGLERIDFLFLLYMTSGRTRHMVDFDSLDCSAGSLVTMQPGQPNRFSGQGGWDGWGLVFRSELVSSREVGSPVADLDFFRDVANLPVHLRLTGGTRQAVTATFERKAEDSTLRAPVPGANALLRHQLQALLIRLLLAHASAARAQPIESGLLQRFRRHRTTVEQRHRQWHRVAEYANDLGCSEKSLNRATMAVTDMGAKSFLTQRIVLEARRLLVHTLSPVASIGDQRGFDEPTNFVKLFRHETGVTPGTFRASHSGR